LAGLLLILFAEPPTAFWTGGDVLAGDWRPTLMAAVLFVVFVVILAVPSLRDFFELAPLTATDSLLIAALLVGWTLLIRAIWRWRIFDRFLRLS
ncbi:MAG: haloacid dehalogenase, partial [Anaerolineae bacterium]|nr:haloacid dehalogenase [Anaerolineae bacterium]